MTRMNTIAPMLSALALATSLSACTNFITGPTTTEERRVSGYSFVEVASGFDVEIRLDTTEGVTIEAPEEAMKHIETIVSGDRLHIGLDNVFNGSFSPRRAIVRVRSLRGVAASGGTEIEGVGTFTAPDFSLEASGGSRVTLSVTAGRTGMSASGGSEITLRGSSDNLAIESFSGGGRFHGFDYATSVTTLEASGGSRLDVRAAARLDVDASGGSAIYYRGHPTITSDLSGGSKIVDAN